MYQEPLPPPVSQLLANPSEACKRYSQHPSTYRRSRLRPSIRSRFLRVTPPDTPSASFYRIYEFFVLDWTIRLRDELEYFCRSHPEWLVSTIPDPKDYGDPVRYAILAVLTQMMGDAFNRRVELGLPRDAPPIVTDFEELAARPKVFEEAPSWAKGVEPLKDRFYIPDKDGNVPIEDDEDLSEEFKRMNIIVRMPHIHFV